MREIIVIADTSCLISLTKIEAIHFLKELYAEVYVTEEVAFEFGETLPEWVLIRKVKDRTNQQILSTFLDIGEASAIALAFEFDNVLLVLDDLKGRKEAEKLGFKITGTLGVLFRAKTSGLIKEIKPLIEHLKLAGFRVSSNVVDEILKKSKEL